MLDALIWAFCIAVLAFVGASIWLCLRDWK